MAVARVSDAGRSDLEGVTPVVYDLEVQQNPGAVMAPDQNVYDPYPDRCVQMKLDGSRCRGKKLPGRHVCMVHAKKEPVDDED